MSYRSPPTDDEIESILCTDVRKMFTDSVDDDMLRTIVHDQYVRFGGRDAIGSMSGWLMETRAVLGRNVIAALQKKA